MRENEALITSDRVRTASVLARPGTPSSRICPPVRSPTSRRSTMASCPTIRRDTSFNIWGTGSTSAGFLDSLGALIPTWLLGMIFWTPAGGAWFHRPPDPGRLRGTMRLLLGVSADGTVLVEGLPAEPGRRRAGPAGQPLVPSLHT